MQPAKGHYDYKWIPVEDNHMADISSHFQEAIEFIGELKGNDLTVVPMSLLLSETRATLFSQSRGLHLNVCVRMVPFCFAL